MEDKKLFSSVADFQNFWLNILCQVCIPFSRPFYIEPTNIVNVNDVIQRVSDHASAMNKRIHYYSRLSTPADKALVRGKALLNCLRLSWTVNSIKPGQLPVVELFAGQIPRTASWKVKIVINTCPASQSSSFLFSLAYRETCWIKFC